MKSKQEVKQKKMLVKANTDYRKNLNSYAFFRLKNKPISEDLVQDTFKKTWAYLVKGGKVNVMKSFLYHVLRGLIIDEYRKKKTISLKDLAKKGLELSEDNSEKMIDILDGEQAIFLIAQLPIFNIIKQYEGTSERLTT